jgi:dephospho-CoA kinase
MVPLDPSLASPGCRAPVVALTGGIGSGKSVVAELFAEWGAAVVDADQLARLVVMPGSPGLTRSVALLGSEVLLPDGALNRKAVAERIFSDPSTRRALEGILHPLIRAAWLEQLQALQSEGRAPLIVYTLPLFFESGVEYPEVEHAIHVSAPEELRIARVQARDNCSAERVRARIAAQLSDAEKDARADFVIHNNGSREQLRARSRAVFEAVCGAR